jgi:hypothetical protein
MITAKRWRLAYVNWNILYGRRLTGGLFKKVILLVVTDCDLASGEYLLNSRVNIRGRRLRG